MTKDKPNSVSKFTFGHKPEMIYEEARSNAHLRFSLSGPMIRAWLKECDTDTVCEILTVNEQGYHSCFISKKENNFILYLEDNNIGKKYSIKDDRSIIYNGNGEMYEGFHMVSWLDLMNKDNINHRLAPWYAKQYGIIGFSKKLFDFGIDCETRIFK